MTVEISDVRKGIIANLAAIVANKYPYKDANPTAPFIMVTGYEPIEPTTFSRGSFQFAFIIQVVVGKPLEQSAQKELDAWISPKGATSVWVALESDRTLGGKVDSSAVLNCAGPQNLLLENGTEVLGSTFRLLVEL